MTNISASDVKKLRDQTGAGFMDCKKALAESNGDFDKAVETLRIKGQAAAAKRSGRTTTEGTIQSYIHANGKIGVLVEVDCETDFVGRNEEFIQFTKDLALHIAAAAPQYVREDEIPEEVRQAELRVFTEQASDKPEQIRPKIAEGKLAKWFSEVVLSNQVHVNTEKYENKTIEELRAELAAKTGENIIIKRFTRFVVGD